MITVWDYWFVASGLSIVVPLVVRAVNILMGSSVPNTKDFLIWASKGSCILIAFSVGIFLIVAGYGGIR